MRLLILAALLTCSMAYAGGSRVIDADSLTSADHTKTWNLPGASAALMPLSSYYTAFIGGSAISGFNVYASINAAIADSTNFPAGSRALIVANQTITAVQHITTANVEFDCLPGVTLTASGNTDGIQVSATRVKLKGCRLTGFQTGYSALLIDAGSNYTMVGEFWFASNVTNMTDNNGKSSTYGIINE